MIIIAPLSFSPKPKLVSASVLVETQAPLHHNSNIANLRKIQHCSNIFSPGRCRVIPQWLNAIKSRTTTSMSWRCTLTYGRFDRRFETFLVLTKDYSGRDQPPNHWPDVCGQVILMPKIYKIRLVDEKLWLTGSFFQQNSFLQKFIPDASQNIQSTCLHCWLAEQ